MSDQSNNAVRPGRDLSALLHHRFFPVAVTGVLLALAGVAVHSPTWQYVLVAGVAWGTVAACLNVWQGYLGEVSFGHGALVAIGAYAWTSARVHEADVITSLVITLVVVAVTSGVFGVAVVQLSHFGSAITTFFLAFMVAAGLQAPALVELTGSQSGMLVPPFVVLGVDLGQGRGLYFLALTVLLVTLLVVANFVNSARGRALRLVRSNEQVAALLGVRIKRLKWMAFVFTGIGAGLGGIILAQVMTVVTPDTFAVHASIILVAMVVVGGPGTTVGPVLGALFFGIVQTAFQGNPTDQALYLSAIFLLFLVLAPAGCVGLVVRGAAAASARWGAAVGGRTADPTQETGAHLAAATPDAQGVVPHAAPRSGRAAIEVEGVEVAFDGVKALGGVDDLVTEGTIHALIGPNGAGKTTLINAITGIQPVTAGTIRVFGEDVTPLPPHAIRAAGVSRTFQNVALVDQLTVLQNVRLGLHTVVPQPAVLDFMRGRLSRTAEDEALERCRAALRAVGLAEALWDVRADSVSMADRKLIDLARALVSRPRVLLLDEPTAGLGENEMHVVENALHRVRATGNVSILLVAHHVAFVRRVADSVTVLDNGRVLVSGSPEDVTTEPRVLEAFVGAALDLPRRESRSRGEVASMATSAADVPGTVALLTEASQPDVGRGTGLTVRGLRAGYGRGRVLDDVSLDVAPGELVGVAGRNGVGKTTLLRALSGLQTRRVAELTLDGAPLPSSPDTVARAGLIHVPEGRGVIPSLTVAENLRVGALAVGRELTNADLEELLVQFPRLKRLLGRRAGLLSGGEQQMLAIARGLAARPRVLMIDELSLGLSPKATREALMVVSAITAGDGPGVLVVDQSIKTLASICDRLYVVRDGTAHPLDASVDSTAELREVYF